MGGGGTYVVTAKIDIYHTGGGSGSGISENILERKGEPKAFVRSSFGLRVDVLQVPHGGQPQATPN